MRVLYIEPFEGGSHAAFGAALRAALPEVEFVCVTLPARHWKWRMRGAAVWVAEQPQLEVDAIADCDLVLASSYLALADLVALQPVLALLPRVLYFHENQLAFPMRPEFSGERDLHYGFTQLISASVATQCWFNSAHNLESFYGAADKLLASMPDARPAGWVDRLRAKSQVMPLCLQLDPRAPEPQADRKDPSASDAGPLIVWNHRWEYDKGPAEFFAALDELVAAKLRFRVAVCGHRFRKVPPEFAAAHEGLSSSPLVEIEQWGPVDARADYLNLLRRSSIAVSSAKHEFFGISMLEAAHAGARPLVPDALAYPEIFDAEFRYAPSTLAARLRELVAQWHAGGELRADRRSVTRRFDLAHAGATFGRAFEALGDTD